MVDIFKAYNNLVDSLDYRIGLLIAIIGIIFLFYYQFWGKNKFAPGARFKKKKVKSNLKTKDKDKALGVVFGLKFWGPFKTRYAVFSPYRDEGHILCVGGSGMGKTSALLIPTLNSWAQAGGSSFTIDISSGDIVKNVKMPRKLIYQPAHSKSNPYNIFGPIDSLPDDYNKNKALAKLALIILPIDPTASEGGKYYNESARNILTASLIAFYHQKLDFISICKKINESTWSSLLNEIDKTECQQAISYINGFVGIEEKLSANIRQTLINSILLFATDMKLEKNLRRPSEGEKYIEPSKIEKNNVFLVIPDDELDYYRPLTQLITSQCLDFFKTRDLNAKHQILFCLDEAASLGTIDLLPPLRKFRKRKIRIFCLTQSLADIDLTWGEKERKAMMSNFKYKIVLECSEPAEQKYWADLVGQTVTTSLSATSGGENDTNTVSEKKDYIIEPSELANLGHKLVLLYPGGHYKLFKNYYYKN